MTASPGERGNGFIVQCGIFLLHCTRGHPIFPASSARTPSPEAPAPQFGHSRAGGRTVGRLGTVIDHYEWGPIALALVKRNVGADAELLIGSAEPDTHEPISARIDPDSIREDDHVQAGRAAVERLRSGPATPGA